MMVICLTLAEALCLDKTVIATKFAGALEQITDGENGYLIDSEVNNIVVKIQDVMEGLG